MTRTDFSDLTIRGYPDLQPIPDGIPSARQASAHVYGTGKLNAGRRQALIHLMIGQHPNTDKWALRLIWYTNRKVNCIVRDLDSRGAALREVPVALLDLIAQIEQATHQEHLPAMPKPTPSKAEIVEWDGGRASVDYASGKSWHQWCRKHAA